jgi:hypothetical protein
MEKVNGKKKILQIFFHPGRLGWEKLERGALDNAIR